MIALSVRVPSPGDTSSLPVPICLALRGGPPILGHAFCFLPRFPPPRPSVPLWVCCFFAVLIAVGFLRVTFGISFSSGFHLLTLLRLLPVVTFRVSPGFLLPWILLVISSFRFLPPRHLVPLWVHFFFTVLIAGGILGAGVDFQTVGLRLRVGIFLHKGQPRLAGFGEVVSPGPYPWLAVPPEALLPWEVELIRAGRILLPGDRVFLRKGLPLVSSVWGVLLPTPRLGLAVPPGRSHPEEVELSQSRRTLTSEDSIIPTPRLRLAVPPGNLHPEEVELLQSWRTLTSDDSTSPALSEHAGVVVGMGHLLFV